MNLRTRLRRMRSTKVAESYRAAKKKAEAGVGSRYKSKKTGCQSKKQNPSPPLADSGRRDDNVGACLDTANFVGGAMTMRRDGQRIRSFVGRNGYATVEAKALTRGDCLCGGAPSTALRTSYFDCAQDEFPSDPKAKELGLKAGHLHRKGTTTAVGRTKELLQHDDMSCSG